MHVTIPPSTLFHVMGAISKESIRKSAAQLAIKWPHVETMDEAPTPQPFSTSAPSSSSTADISLTDIMDQLQHMHANFGSHLDYLCDEMCQMNTRIGRIAHHQSRLAGFMP